MRWAADSPQLLAVNERDALYILRSGRPEEPVPTAARLCAFSNLQIMMVRLDNVLAAPEAPDLAPLLLRHEARSLRDARGTKADAIKARTALGDAAAHASANGHPRLWRAVAEAALAADELEAAERAFVRCSDYNGVQLARQLATVESPILRRAAAAIHCGRLDLAEAAYQRMGRADLALDMRARHGDWLAVERALVAAGGDAAALAAARNHLGNHYADRRQWAQAAALYKASGMHDRLAAALFAGEDWPGLIRLSAALPAGAPLLLRLGAWLQSAGLAHEAATAFVRAGDVRRAVDACVQLSDFGRATAANRPQAAYPAN
ncbi:hypothetical protein WJX81_001701 [Elliptochloris bilobata]|uniref:IFT121 second beta-propeller domain-containing protein n=1 Tax=Elliptochloris bilobata TaxID=381761 RepID=A0AAW1QMY1_9CHLO